MSMYSCSFFGYSHRSNVPKLQNPTLKVRRLDTFFLLATYYPNRSHVVCDAIVR